MYLDSSENSLQTMERHELIAHKQTLEAERSTLRRAILSDELNETWREGVWNDHHSQRANSRTQRMQDCVIELGIIGDLLGA